MLCPRSALLCCAAQMSRDMMADFKAHMASKGVQLPMDLAVQVGAVKRGARVQVWEVVRAPPLAGDLPYNEAPPRPLAPGGGGQQLTMPHQSLPPVPHC